MERSDRTRARILERLETHVFRYGFSALTMEQAGELAGVSKRTLYKYFPNKDALLEDLFRRRFSLMGELVDSHLSDAPEAWFAAYSRIILLLGRFLSSLSPVLMRDLAVGDPRYWEMISAFRRKKVFSVLERLIEAGRERGEIRTDLDPKIMSQLFVSFIDDIANPNRLIALPYSMTEVISTMMDILFKGMLSDAGRERFPAVRLDLPVEGEDAPGWKEIIGIGRNP